ncbi:polysaccharide deacetylase family protein [Halorubellus salinus]|uniref:polysaccharide deacetylase family protein n=1 Tax=Halorubellus salinus TaxID=755309 RepID=UPI001D08A325|nr:polysaccharide deacetylase family protein [Halorubellus salinus]
MVKEAGTPERNAISFDLEHWYTATLLADEVDDPVDHVEDSVEIVLNVLDQHDVTATFFVSGDLAVAYPTTIGEIADAGHELGSHGHSHTPLFELTPSTFETEIEQSETAIEEAANVDVKGFRAPNFSVTPRTAWAFRVLESNGYEYDSSVFPMRTPMYGVSGAPVQPYVVDDEEPFREVSNAANRSGLIEVPIAVVGSRLRLPIAGGFYARLFPTKLLEWGIRRLNAAGISATLYFHPWEFNPAVPVTSPPIHKRLISFYGVDGAVEKLDHLLESFEWGPVESLVDRSRRVDDVETTQNAPEEAESVEVPSR